MSRSRLMESVTSRRTYQGNQHKNIVKMVQDKENKCTDADEDEDEESIRCPYCGMDKKNFLNYKNNNWKWNCTKCIFLNGPQTDKIDKIKPSPKGPNVSVLIIGLIVLIVSIVSIYMYCPSSNSNIQDPVGKLKEQFPKQIDETWQWIRAALSREGQNTKVMLLLYSNDDEESTCNCLIKEIAKTHKNSDSEELEFNRLTDSEKDYGEVLQHYRPLVEKHRVFFFDLNAVSGNIARMFHFLYDETYPEGNPALLLFKLRDQYSDQNIKPMMKAQIILKKLWKNLPENEISPLLSRIVRNVISVLPEENKSCTFKKN